MPIEHTPWRVQEMETERHGYADWKTHAIRDSRNICLAVVGEVDHATGDSSDIAHLMAAAPELLDALNALHVAVITHTSTSADDISRACFTAERALVKARGR